MTHHRFTRPAALALALCAVAAPTAAANSPVPPPPSSIAASAGTGYQHLRADPRYQDLRSPDARDAGLAAAEGRETFYAFDRGGTRVAETSPGPSDSFDWGDAGIGAGGLFALMLLGLGSTLTVTHRRHRGRRQPATTG